MTVVVTGASGHIGANLVRTLIARGERVRVVVHRDARALDGLDVERVSGDVRDADAMTRACAGAEVVYHLAAMISIDGGHGGRVEAINVGGTRNVALACRSAGARMLYVSSIHAFQQMPFDQPLDESRARVPWGDGRWPMYDQSKAEGEREVRKLIADGLDAVIFHPTGVVGPWDFGPSRVGGVFLKLWHRRLPSLVEGGFDWVDVRDVVSALVSAADPARGRCGESYLLTGSWQSVEDLARTSAAITGVAPPRLKTPTWLAKVGAPFMTAYARMTGDEPIYTLESLHALRSNRDMRSDKARAALDFAPRPFATSVYDTYVWHREHGHIAADAPLRQPA